MERFTSYEFVSAVMVAITLACYSGKNWVDLRKNKIYFRLLVWAEITMAGKVILGLVASIFPERQAHMELIVQQYTGVGLIVLYALFVLYDLALTGKMKMIPQLSRYIHFCIVIGVGVFAAVSPFLGFGSVELFGRSILWSNIFVLLAAMLYLACGFICITRYKDRMTPREKKVVNISNVVLAVSVFFQETTSFDLIVADYCVAWMLILYYMLLHNVDQYRLVSSSCFTRAGFRSVSKEKEHYKENFACIGISINNIESITSFCSDREINGAHRIIGKTLRQVCGRHNVYQMHSFEYVVVFKNKEAAKRKHEELVEALPKNIRINNKTIELICGYYLLDFADANYSVKDLHRIFTSMRKMSGEQTDRKSLMSYEGAVKERIQDELEALNALNACISKKSFGLIYIVIQSFENPSDLDLEISIQDRYKDKVDIFIEQIWKLANETGYGREIGLIYCRQICEWVQKENMFAKGFHRIHINFSPAQLTGVQMAQEYLKIFKENQIPGENICMEITIDQTVDYESLTQVMEMLKEYGIYLLLDQFGISVCNLRKTLNLPFDAVKINHHLVEKYCIGDSAQLEYMTGMLRSRGWKLYYDGVHTSEQKEILEKLHADYHQGYLTYKILCDKFANLAGGDGDA